MINLDFYKTRDGTKQFGGDKEFFWIKLKVMAKNLIYKFEIR